MNGEMMEYMVDRQMCIRDRYNDIPSMIGYLFTLLIIYKLHIKPINGLFVLTNKISYEWYLVHMLSLIHI